MPILSRQHSGRLSAIIFVIPLLAAVLTGHAVAADLVVVTAGAFKPVLLDLAPAYESRTHDKIALSNDTAGAVAERVAQGEAIDLVILPTGALDTLAKQGKIAPGSVIPVGKTGIGAIVKQGAPAPDISSVEALKRTLLAAPSVAYIDPSSGGSSGIYIAKLLERLGIGDVIRGKTVLVQGGLVASRVSNGDAALGLQQISELRASPGVSFVGPLPEEVQNYTVYAAAIPAAARNPDRAKALQADLRGETAGRILENRGLQQP
jgi:molybdate transport system substrate-binding protein